MEIRHIPGKKILADSLRRQLVSDALVRKEYVKNANEEYVMRLRVQSDATDEENQSALHHLFNKSAQCPQGKFNVMNGDQDPSQYSEEIKPSVIAPTAVSKLQLDNSFRNSLYSLLRNEAPYDGIITELESGRTQVVKKDEVFKRMNGILAVHSHHQDAELDFWRILVPSDVGTRDVP